MRGDAPKRPSPGTAGNFHPDLISISATANCRPVGRHDRCGCMTLGRISESRESAPVRPPRYLLQTHGTIGVLGCSREAPDRLTRVSPRAHVRLAAVFPLCRLQAAGVCGSPIARPRRSIHTRGRRHDLGGVTGRFHSHTTGNVAARCGASFHAGCFSDRVSELPCDAGVGNERYR